MTWSRGKIAALLFIVGGALSLTAALLGLAGSSVGGWIGLVGLLLEGAAFVLFGLDVRAARSRRWVPWLYAIAGVLMLVTALLALVGGSLGAAAIVVQLAIAALIIVPSVLLLSGRASDHMLIVALIVLGALLAIAVFVGNIVLAVLIAAAYIVVGILLWGVRLGRRRP